MRQDLQDNVILRYGFSEIMVIFGNIDDKQGRMEIVIGYFLPVTRYS